MNIKPNSLAGKTITDRKGLAKVLVTTERHVKTLGDEKKIPVLNWGHRTKRYCVEDCLAALQRFEVAAVS